MRSSLNPSVPEIVRVNSNNIDEAIAQLVGALTPSGGGFNYIPATVATKLAYRGVHRIDQLLSIKSMKDGSVGAGANAEVVTLAAPFAFGRETKVFDLTPRTFAYAGRSASYRIPFFFVEKGVIKLYFLQPRKNTVFTLDQVSLYASLAKKFLMDSEFFGETTDLEIVETAVRQEGEARKLQVYSLSELEIWDDSKIQRHLAVVDEALKFIEAANLIPKTRRPLKDKDLPLFS